MLSDDELHSTVQDHYSQVDRNDWDDIYVVGDIHGCLDTFERLIDKIEPDESTLLIVVGDLVRKGPDSRGVLRFVRAHENIVSVRGNNEAKIIRGDKTIDGLTDEDRAYLKSLPVIISWDETLVVHGGIDPRRPLADQSREELLTMRSFTHDNGYERPYWFEEYSGRYRVFFGHTVLEAPYESADSVGLDTGCVYGGQLTAYHVDSGQFLSVAPGETFQPRSSDTIVTVPAAKS